MITKRLKKAFGIGALVLALGIGTLGCERKVIENETEPKRIEVKVGEYKSGARWNKAAFELTYAGMNNEKTFSISSFVYGAVNFYYPTDSKEIEFGINKFKVVEVTPEHIILDYLGKSKDK